MSTKYLTLVFVLLGMLATTWAYPSSAKTFLKIDNDLSVCSTQFGAFQFALSVDAQADVEESLVLLSQLTPHAEIENVVEAELSLGHYYLFFLDAFIGSTDSALYVNLAKLTEQLAQMQGVTGWCYADYTGMAPVVIGSTGDEELQIYLESLF